MHKISLYQVDAFTDRLFFGNPAAVCPSQGSLSVELMHIDCSANYSVEFYNNSYVLTSKTIDGVDLPKQMSGSELASLHVELPIRSSKGASLLLEYSRM